MRLEIFQFLIENHRGCVFQFEITADIMRPEVLDYLAEHAPPGIFRFEIGVQSTNDLTNEAVQRRQNFTKLTRTVMKVKESGKIDQHLDLIAGLPHEDYDSFRKTFNDVFDLVRRSCSSDFSRCCAAPACASMRRSTAISIWTVRRMRFWATMFCRSRTSFGSNESRTCWRNIGMPTGWTIRCCI